MFWRSFPLNLRREVPAHINVNCFKGLIKEDTGISNPGKMQMHLNITQICYSKRCINVCSLISSCELWSCIAILLFPIQNKSTTSLEASCGMQVSENILAKSHCL